MAAQLDEKAVAVLKSKSFGHLATLNKDGSPQVTPVWVDTDGKHVIVNSEEKRLKVRNIKRDPRVSISLLNPDNPYEYIEIRGKVTSVTTEGGAAGIDRLSKKYLGQDSYPYNQPTDVRVVITIQPERVAGMAR